MEIPEYIDALQLGGAQLSAAVRRADPDAPVPPCPGWVVRDLVLHLGGIHRWATVFVAQARLEAIEEDLEELVGGWPEDSDLFEWFDEGHADLITALRDAPTDLSCFTFLEAASPLAMWARRQAHETAIHRIDAESATGPVTGFTSAFAADGIDELLTAFITRPGRGPRADRPTSMAVVPDDRPERWTVYYDAESCRTERTAEASALEVRGAASDLYAWLWNRPNVGAVEERGDEALVARWRTTVHVRWS